MRNDTLLLPWGRSRSTEEVSDLREEWMPHADQVLADEQIVAAVYEALARRHPKSRSRGRLGAPAEVVLRLLVLKHIRNLSYAALEREVRANLVYRDFTRVGGGKMPDAKTMGRWGLAVGPQVLKQIHDRMVEIARDKGIVVGRRMRVDTTAVETNIHHPTDSTLLGDGVRVLTRAMRRITDIVGAVGTKLRDRSRSVKLRLFEIARIARTKGPLNRDRLQQRYSRLLASIPPGTRRRQKQWVSSACAFPIAQARAPSASASKRSVGSATARNGAPDAKDASAWSSGAMASIAVDIRATMECSVGSDSA
jgi:IS5 family transposase